MRVLLADDDAGIRLVVSLNLQRRGWDVDTAVDGDDALAQATSGVYDAIVLDQLMPGMTGIEVAEHLTRDVPVIIYSAFVDDHVQRRAAELGLPTVGKADIPELLAMLDELRAG
ncbi:MAG: response regulator [Nitriliruptor sp.]|uniref:response regulator n=1 Tax=Nitriliruptor sp. TaxID=2448056 RepID=UPI0034A0A98A